MSQYCTIHMTLTRHTTMMPYYTVLCCYYTSRDHHNKKYLMMSPESLTPSFVNEQITTANYVTEVQYHGTWSSN